MLPSRAPKSVRHVEQHCRGKKPARMTSFVLPSRRGSNVAVAKCALSSVPILQGLKKSRQY